MTLDAQHVTVTSDNVLNLSPELRLFRDITVTYLKRYFSDI